MALRIRICSSTCLCKNSDDTFQTDSDDLTIKSQNDNTSNMTTNGKRVRQMAQWYDVVKYFCQNQCQRMILIINESFDKFFVHMYVLACTNYDFASILRLSRLPMKIPCKQKMKILCPNDFKYWFAKFQLLRNIMILHSVERSMVSAVDLNKFEFNGT